jgi:hypothetical protein
MIANPIAAPFVGFLLAAACLFYWMMGCKEACLHVELSNAKLKLVK